MARGAKLNIRSFRTVILGRKHGMTDADIARKLGVSRQSVYQKVHTMRKMGIIVPTATNLTSNSTENRLRRLAVKLGLKIRGRHAKAA